MASSGALSIVEEVVHTWEERGPSVSAGPISLAIIVVIGSFFAAWLSRVFLLSMYALWRYMMGDDIKKTWWWTYLCCCYRPRRRKNYKQNLKHHSKRRARAGDVLLGMKDLVMPHGGGDDEVVHGGRNNRAYRRKRNPLRNVYNLFVLLVGVGIIVSGVIWALHIIEAPLSLLVSLGIIGYIVGQAMGPTVGNVICGVIIYLFDLVEIGEFIMLRDGTKGYVRDLTVFWVVLDDPSDDHHMDKLIYVKNAEVVDRVYQFPRHEEILMQD